MTSIRPYNTLKVDHQVGAIHIVDSEASLRETLATLDSPIIIGGGSNVLFTADSNRPVVIIDIRGIQIEHKSDQHTIINVGAGEIWHDLVLWSIKHQLGGIENLSLIPGKCGAAPIQNIGAYGVELEDVLISVTCMNRLNGASISVSKDSCKLSYRDSIFKNEYKDEYVITSIKLKLTNSPFHQINSGYGDIKKKLVERGINNPSISDISMAVISIRQSKLPDPQYLPNAGSFFKNPILTTERCDDLKWRFPLMPFYPFSDDYYKIPAGWLIDQCGWKGVMIDQVGVHNRQALVIVNHGCRDGQKIVKFSNLIQTSVRKRFGIDLIPEVSFI